MSQFVLVILFLTGLVLQVSYEYHTVNVVSWWWSSTSSFFLFMCFCCQLSSTRSQYITAIYMGYGGLEGLMSHRIAQAKGARISGAPTPARAPTSHGHACAICTVHTLHHHKSRFHLCGDHGSGRHHPHSTPRPLQTSTWLTKQIYLCIKPLHYSGVCHHCSPWPLDRVPQLVC